MEFTPALLAFVFVVFLVAGLVKGVTGLGLPTVAMGLLATRLPPLNAIAIMIVPAIATNIWQTFAGPYLRALVRRLWPLLLSTVLGVVGGSGLLVGPYAPYGTVALGILLVIYGLISLLHVRFHLSRKDEGWTGAICGLLSGLSAAMTGVQIIPAVVYLQAIEMERDEFVQALGLFFTTATLAQIFNLTNAGLMSSALLLPALIGLGASLAGMHLGQILRERMEPDTFRRWFLISILLLGAYIAVDKIIRLHLI
ncbi:MAG: sulfite exporter TauE/SafE family protein [Bradyrhizobiaceae bacterium]|nr:MAG: sulfite exporter TauE/SafE family protein [Bradyrhizobiaceae bacterium]